MDVIAGTNRYFANAEPWKLAKSDPARMGIVLYVTMDILRTAGVLLQPVMPTAMAKLLDLLALDPDPRGPSPSLGGEGALEAANRLKPGTALPPPTGVFPRYVEA